MPATYGQVEWAMGLSASGRAMPVRAAQEPTPRTLASARRGETASDKTAETLAPAESEVAQLLVSLRDDSKTANI
jgi:hypothetical protein